MIQIKVDTDGGGKYKYIEYTPNLSLEKSNQFFQFSELDYGRSISFQIPRTEGNEKTLQDAGQVYEYGQMMRIEIPCRIQYGAIEKDGKLTIDSATQTSYSCTLYTELSNLLDWVNGRKLKEYGADWTVFWNYAHAHAANDPGVPSKVMDIIPYSSEVPQNYIHKDEWCWLPAINIRKVITNLFGVAQSNTGDYSTRTYDLFNEVPQNQRDIYWLVLNSNNGSGSHSINFRMQNNVPIVPMGDLGELEFDLYSAYNESFLNGQRYAWVCDKDVVITVPQNFPTGIMLCSVHKKKGNFHTWLNEDPLTWYVNLKNFWAASSHVPGNATLQPGDRIRITAGTHFAFYALSDLYWSSSERMHVFSQNLQGGNYQLTLEVEFKEEIPLMPSQSSSTNLYHFSDNAPDMTLPDLCKMYGMLTNTVFTFEDHEIRFLKDAGYHDVPITDCIYFSEVQRLVGDWAVDEKVCFDSDDYVEQPVYKTYHTDNLAVEQNENEHKLKASEGFLRQHSSYFGDGIFVPAAKRLAIHDASVEYEDDNTTIKKVKIDMKKPVVASLQTGNVRTLKRVSSLPENPYYKSVVDSSTKVKAKWKMDIEEFIKMDHTYRFVYRGRKYIWLDAKWNNGLVECTLQLSDYTAVEEYYINVTYSNGGDAGTSGYAQIGDTYYIWARPSTGFTFDHWELNGTTVSGAGQDYSFTVDGDANWHAVFLGDEVTITATPSPAGAGTTTGSGTYRCGEMCTVTATALPAHAFIEWQENGAAVSQDAAYSFVVTGSRTLVAVFETLEKYNIQVSIDPSGVGTVTGGGSYYSGTTCTVTTTPDQRAYAFVGWYDLGTGLQVSTSSVYSFVVTGDRSLQARYYGGHKVSTSCSPNGAGTTYGDGMYDEGDLVTVGFTAAERTPAYTFDHWEEMDDPGVTVSTSNPYSFNIHSDRNLIAFCSESALTVTALVAPTGSGTVTGAGEYVSGTTCTLTATPANGYTFNHWEIGGTSVGQNTTYSFTVTQNVTVTAVFTQDLYTVSTVSSPANGGTTSGGGTFNYGDSCTVTATPATGYNFVKWTVGGTQVSVSQNYTFTVTGNTNLVAVFAQQTWSISTTVYPDASGTTTGDGQYAYGENFTISCTPAHGYEFSAWRHNLSDYNENPLTRPMSSSWGGQWQAIMTPLTERTITAIPYPEKAGTCVAQTYPFFDGDTCTLTAFPNTGASFSHWANTIGGASVSTLNPYQITVSGDQTIYGIFTWNQYQVTTSVTPTGHGTVSGSGTYTYGNACTCTIDPQDDYIVEYWELNGQNVQNGGNSFQFSVGTVNNVVCHLVQGTFYDITATPNPRSLGTITGPGHYLAGTQCTLSIAVASHYTFDHWELNGQNVSSNTSYTFTVDGDKDFTAEGSQIYYQIEGVCAPLQGGTITGTGNYPYGTQVILEAVPNRGYAFTGWWENNVEISTSASITFTVTQSRTLYARFESLPSGNIYVYANPSAGGTVSGAGVYYQGESVTVSAAADGKYYFHHWSNTSGGSSISTANPWTFTMGSTSQTLVANFYVQQYNVTAAVKPNSQAGTVSGGGTYEKETSCTLTATANTGYKFDHWEDGEGNVVGYSSTYTIASVDQRYSLYAVFVEDGVQYTISVTQSGGGTVTGGGTYSKDDYCTLTATPVQGARFDHWSDPYQGTNFGSSNPWTFQVTQNMNVWAVFY